jgi:hypothetical protein
LVCADSVLVASSARHLLVCTRSRVRGDLVFADAPRLRCCRDLAVVVLGVACWSRRGLAWPGAAVRLACAAVAAMAATHVYSPWYVSFSFSPSSVPPPASGFSCGCSSSWTGYAVLLLHCSTGFCCGACYCCAYAVVCCCCVLLLLCVVATFMPKLVLLYLTSCA